MSNELLERERSTQLRVAGEAVEASCQRLKRSEVWFHYVKAVLDTKRQRLTVCLAGKVFKRWPYKTSRHLRRQTARCA